MTYRLIARSLLVLLAVFCWPGPVRAQDLSGTWRMELPVRIGNTNGIETVEQTAVVRLTFTREGDAVVAHWQMTPPDGEPQPEPRTLRGVVRDGRVVLTDTADAMIRTHDSAPTTIRMVDTIEFTVSGDELVGTRSGRSLDGTVSSPARPISARRDGR